VHEDDGAAAMSVSIDVDRAGADRDAEIVGLDGGARRRVKAWRSGPPWP
jgi:hypothetical protein